jgi:hypothetical protein
MSRFFPRRSPSLRGCRKEASNTFFASTAPPDFTFLTPWAWNTPAALFTFARSLRAFL